MSDHTASIPIVCSPAPERKSLGTAWLCAPGRAMTAWHVLTAHGGTEFLLVFPDGSERRARLFDSSAQADHGLQTRASESKGSRPEPYLPLDVAVLGFAAAADDPPPLALNDDGDVCREGWTTFGYPSAAPQGFPSSGTVTDQRGHTLYLMCQEDDRYAWRGLSGAPVIDQGGAVIATITSFPEEIYGALYATPLRDAWRTLQRWRAEATAAPSSGPVTAYLERMLPSWRRRPYTTSLINYGSATKPLDDIFIAPRFRGLATKTARRDAEASGVAVRFETLANELRAADTRPWLIRGDPGTGKSAFLRWVCASCASYWMERSEVRCLVPVLAHANELVGTDLAALIEKKIDNRRVCPPADAIWLVLLDGLDELISEAHRSEVIDRIRAAGRKPKARGCNIRLVVTSRPIAALEALDVPHANHRVLMPFDFQRLVEFAQAWFPRETQGDMAQQFVAQVRRSRVEGMTSVPAMATMAAIVFSQSVDERLPTSRVDLYDRFIELMLQVRSPEAHTAFYGECSRHFAELPDLGRLLLIHREDIASHLATVVQAGVIVQGPADLVAAAVPFCQQKGWLPVAATRSVRHGLQHRLLRELLLGSGLFVAAGEPDQIDFFHNTLREALVAKTVGASVGDDAESISQLMDRWPEARSREVVLLALVRVSTRGDAARRHVGQAVGRVVQAAQRGRQDNQRGLHFVGTALAEGLRLDAADEHAVVAALMERIGKWNPCLEFYSEFRSPNPLDVLRRMPDNDILKQALLQTLRTEPTRCAARLGAYLEYVIDIGRPEEFEDVLLQPGPAADAATVMLLRAGHGAQVLDNLHALLMAPERRYVNHLGLAFVAGELLPAVDAARIGEDTRVEDRLRIALASRFWRREPARWAQTVVTQLLHKIVLSKYGEADDALARAAVAVTGVLCDRPQSDSTTLVLLRAWIGVAEQDATQVPVWVTALIDEEAGSIDLRLAACALALRAGSVGAWLDRCVELLMSQEWSSERPLLLDTLVDLQQTVALQRAWEREQSWSHRSDIAVALARCGERKRALAWVRTTMSANAAGSPEWQAALTALAEVGETEQAARAVVDLARKQPTQSINTKQLRSWGATDSLAEVVRIAEVAPETRRHIVRTLCDMGAHEVLKKVSEDTEVSPLVRLEAFKEFEAIGLSADAARAYASCTSTLGVAHSASEMEKKAYRYELERVPWPPTIADELRKRAAS